MSVQISLDYLGRLTCQLRHGPSGNELTTDAPLDNGGQGSAFSPTDLVAAALLSCAVTTMAIKAGKAGIELPSLRGSVVKEMTRDPPRRVARLAVELSLPPLSESDRVQVIEFARTCPVALSLAPTVEVVWTFG